MIYLAASQGSNRVIRGGSWNNTAENCRAAQNGGGALFSLAGNGNAPENRNNNLGFRPAALYWMAGVSQKVQQGTEASPDRAGRKTARQIRKQQPGASLRRRLRMDRTPKAPDGAAMFQAVSDERQQHLPPSPPLFLTNPKEFFLESFLSQGKFRDA